MRYYISSPSVNPVSRLIGAILTLFALVGAFFFGLVILVVLVAVIALFVLGLRLRVWWLARHPVDSIVVKTHAVPDGNEINAEYTVVSRRRG